MALEQKLSLKLAQKLVMTPSLQQAIKLLQMTRLELDGVLNQELEENPVLEEGVLEEESANADQEEEAADESQSMDDIDLDAFFSDYAESWEGSRGASVYEERQGPPLENSLAHEDDLYDQLLWQLHMSDATPLQREIAELIIGNLDSEGFLKATVREIMALGIPEEAKESEEAEEDTATEGEAATGDGNGVGANAALANTAGTDPPALAGTEPPALAGTDPPALAGTEPPALAGTDPPAVAGTDPPPLAGLVPLESPDLLVRSDDPILAGRPTVDPARADQPKVDHYGSPYLTAASPEANAPEAVTASFSDPAIPASAEEAADLVLDAVLEALEQEEAEEVEEPDPEGGYSRADVEDALALVRRFDPAGVACRDLRECLLLQMHRQGMEEDSQAYRMVAEYWDLFKSRKFEAIAKAMGCPLKSLRPGVEAIRALETRPGREYNTDRTHYVEPDVHIVKVGEEYVVQLNDDGMPRLRVSKQYRKMLQEMKRDSSQTDARQYIKDKMRSALWLIKSLDQRQRTIYKVAQSIVQQQRAFLDYGLDHLRPMVLRDVAEDIEMHESTVSRVVSNKYMHTHRGLFPMKFFFHSGIDREYGGDISSLTVKRKIQHLIQDENPKKPLSDSELMRRLNKDGIHIARRTVAKYRDELNIPSSTDRKKIF